MDLRAPANRMEQLTGGVGTLASAKPVKTPVSYWPTRHHAVRLYSASDAHYIAGVADQ